MDHSTHSAAGTSGDDLTSLRLRLRRNGYWPVPIAGPTMKIKSAGKRPLMDAWQKLCIAPSETEVMRWTREEPDSTNTGLLCGPAVGGDIDVRVAELVRQLVDRARVTLGDTPLERVGMPPKTLLAYRTETPFRKISTAEFILPGDDWTVPGYKGHRVEILAEGQQFVAYGIHPDTRQPYQWLRGGPDTIAWSDLPVIPV
jgi:putative DNA primase/helicase